MSEEMQGPDHPAFQTLKTGFHSHTRVSIANTCRCSVMLLSTISIQGQKYDIIYNERKKERH